MVIKGFTAIDNTPISKLKRHSRKIVIKQCDICFDVWEAQYRDVLDSRERWSKHLKFDQNGPQDFCYKCAIEYKNTGKYNLAKREEVGQKISVASRGKSKPFKGGINPRILEFKKAPNGYLLQYDYDRKRHIAEHRLIFEKFLNRKLKKEEQIHHIDGDKVNNSIGNLYLCSNNSKHSSIHSQLQNIAFNLVKKGIILFNHKEGRYYISPNVELNTMDISLGFNDISIKQNKNLCQSRLDVNIRSEIVRDIHRDVPLVAANMSTVVNADFCIKLYKLGALGILHRAYQNDQDYIDNVIKIANECDIIAASVGVGKGQFALSKRLLQHGCNLLVIDIAHGYSDTVIDLAKRIKKYSPTCKVVIGNVSNPEIMYQVSDFVDGVKLGIANGLACETKSTAGCNEKQFSTVMKFKDLSRKFGLPIISDGSIRDPSDFVKAIGAGANSAMAGSVLARCPESAAEVIKIDGEYKKLYAGMASRYVQKKWRGGLKLGTCPEGKVLYLNIGESVDDLIERYSGALKSGITYAGGNDIRSFQNCVEFVRVTTNTVIENGARV